MNLTCVLLGHEWAHVTKKKIILRYGEIEHIIDGALQCCLRCDKRRIIPNHKQYMECVFGATANKSKDMTEAEDVKSE